KGSQFYRGGLVFKPSGTVAADEYNLFRGMLVVPDASGSCSLFYDLIREVWTREEDAELWVTEQFMHMIRFPGEKVRTSMAIRGGYGDGKSIIAEKLMSIIL